MNSRDIIAALDALKKQEYKVLLEKQTGILEDSKVKLRDLVLSERSLKVSVDVPISGEICREIQTNIKKEGFILKMDMQTAKWALSLSI